MRKVKKIFKIAPSLSILILLLSACTPIDMVEEADFLIDAVEVSSGFENETPKECEAKEVFYRNGEWLK